MHAKIERSLYLSSIESLCIFVRKFRNQKFLDREFRSIIRKIDSRVTCNFVLGCSDERQRGIKSSLLFSKGGRLRLIDRESSTLLMEGGGEGSSTSVGWFRWLETNGRNERRERDFDPAATRGVPSENGSDSTSPMVNSSSSKKEEVDYRY